MKKIISTLVIAAAMIGALPVMAQERHVSPHETLSSVIDGNRVTITYGRPYSTKPGTTEARKIWGGLVPYGQSWRMGADEATTLITQKALEIGGKTIPAGVYTLYMLPSETGVSQLVFSSALGGWGIPVDTKHDFAKVELTKEAMDKPADQFTMGITKNPAGGGLIKLSWENTAYSVAFTLAK
ncbi:MAG TPA: DUF2911 domain-containing protein [Verrucomicrobiae bacterium]